MKGPCHQEHMEAPCNIHVTGTPRTITRKIHKIYIYIYAERDTYIFNIYIYICIHVLFNCSAGADYVKVFVNSQLQYGRPRHPHELSKISWLNFEQ